MTILTTCCYLKVDGKTLMLYRNKKQNDINEGKWIGIGGKIENGESPLDCVKREFLEETGLEISDIRLKAYITFPQLHSFEDEGMFLYVAYAYKGKLKENCNEGKLSWINDDMISTLPMWEGDKYFSDFLSSTTFIEAKFTYEKDQLKETIITHY